jgi:maleylpyruvate isomerase
MILYDYGLSSASYRVRIALALKQLPYTSITKNLLAGDQRLVEYLRINTQGFVPALQVEEDVLLTQSAAIMEYLDEMHPQPPLMPSDALGRARVRALMQVIICDVHPLNNLRVLKYLKDNLHVEKEERDAWYRHWVEIGLDALERRLNLDAATGRFCHGNTPTLADLCLVPQVLNARRYSVDLNPYPRILAIDAACRELPAFTAAAPPPQNP